MSNTIVYINENNELITENPTTTATDIGTNISKDLNIGTKLHKINVNDSMVINGNLSIKGNMSVYGNTSIVHSDIIRVDDPLIYLAQNNNADDLNIGFYGSYKNSGNTRYTGFIRDPNDNTFKILRSTIFLPRSRNPLSLIMEISQYSVTPKSYILYQKKYSLLI